MTTKITTKGQVTIPKRVRDAMGVKAGANVSVEFNNGSAVVKPSKWPRASEAQGANFAEAVATLKDAGAVVREVPLPKAFDDAWNVVRDIMDFDAARAFFAIESRNRLQLSAVLVELLDRGKRIAPEAHAKNLARREEYRRWLDGLFDGCDVIATIPAVGEAPEGLGNTGDATFCSLWTLTGLPAVTIPSGRGPRGLPLGLQLVGRYREDERALQVAAWCEATLGVSMGFPD